ncbi:MAG: DUF4252 domain-containing protein [Candidatus Krumholzibacteria bacterium]|nr:DUF4252 domain-containing protein [Candidatus Krumholzibacteria bacterium]
MGKPLTVLIGCSLGLTLFSGCLWAPDLDRVRREIQQQLPGARFERQFAISLGPVSLRMARALVRFVPEAEEARGYLCEVRDVKVAVYEARNVPDKTNIKMPEQLLLLVEKHHWEIGAKVRHSGENVWLLYRSDGDSIKDLYAVVLGDDELVLVRARGNIDRLLAKAVRDHLGSVGDLGLSYN